MWLRWDHVNVSGRGGTPVPQGHAKPQGGKPDPDPDDPDAGVP
jgi:hypothetical protein